jgi:hypothetical protein
VDEYNELILQMGTMVESSFAIKFLIDQKIKKKSNSHEANDSQE